MLVFFAFLFWFVMSGFGLAIAKGIYYPNSWEDKEVRDRKALTSDIISGIFISITGIATYIFCSEFPETFETFLYIFFGIIFALMSIFGKK